MTPVIALAVTVAALGIVVDEAPVTAAGLIGAAVAIAAELRDRHR